ncbi:MAG: hypothetical protein GX557_15245, partial [Chloroflexi bacterium]|nr:hypothetical protein [Chloroflexota bacterium]
MKLWMDVMRDLEYLLDDPQPILDAWEAGGVDGLVIGPLVFGSYKLVLGTRVVDAGAAQVATFDPDPSIYRQLGVEPPEAPADGRPEQRARLERLLSDVKRRGW